jgi:hypothetical protein
MFGWSKKGERSPPKAPVEDKGPPGEAEAVSKIQRLCWISGMSAIYLDPNNEEYAVFADIPERQEYERNRYNEFRAKALRVADTLTDEFYRWAAIHLIIDTCMKAADEDDARNLLKHVEVDFIREKIEAAYPQLKQPKLSTLVRPR